MELVWYTGHGFCSKFSSDTNIITIDIRQCNNMALFRTPQVTRVAYILQHSITRRLLVVVFSIYLVITVTVTLLHMDFEYEFSKRQTIESLKNIQAMTHDSISQAIWEFNNTQLDAILNGLISNQYIVGVKLAIPDTDTNSDLKSKVIGLVDDSQGNIVYVNPNDKTIESVHYTFERLIPYVFPIEHTDALSRTLVIGTMVLYSSNTIVFEQVKASYILIIVNAIIKTLALWIFFLWAGYHFISKPLAQLTEAINQLARGNWDTELIYTTVHSKQKTEINTLFDTFNQMISNLRTTEAKLRNSRNRLNTIFDTMPSALISINNSHIVQSWNKDTSQITGIATKDAIGKNLNDIFPELNDYMYLIQKAIKFNKEQRIQHIKIAPVETKCNNLYQVTFYPLLSLSPPEVIIRIDDVTEQVKNEAGFAQVEKLASVGASIAGVAHEINNPLASIMLSTQNIQRRLSPDMEANQQVATQLGVDLKKQYQYLEEREIIKFLENIHYAGERASNIVKNMLKFTRRSTSDMTQNNIIDVINDSLELASHDISIQEHLEFKDIVIEKDFCSQDIEIECYPLEIQQVLLNLIRNAAQAFDIKQNDKHIKISLQQLEDNKITITVSDNGQGIDPAILDQIFQPFFTTKPIGQGTGLGLSVCKNIIVQRHHGNLDVKSTPGEGTTFIMTLPIQQSK